MSDSNSRTSKDNDETKYVQNLDQEYEEISGTESPNPNASRNSVNFILDEKGFDSTETVNVDRNHSFSVPTINVESAPASASASASASINERNLSSEAFVDNEPAYTSNSTSLADIFGEDNLAHNDRSPLPFSTINEALLHENYNDKKSPGYNFKKQLSAFESETGGLIPDCSDDSKNTLFFDDGKRRIDLILAYEYEDTRTPGDVSQEETLRMEYRKTFEESLRAKGLELEIVDEKSSFDEKTCFIKIHCPINVLEKYAAKMHMKKPVREGKEDKSFDNGGCCSPFFHIFDITSPLVRIDPTLHTSIFSGRNQDKLLVKDREPFFTSSQRSQVVWHILLRARFAPENNVGIRKLLNNKAYISAFPLHEGRYDEDTNFGFTYDRRILYHTWAKPTQWYKYQPLWLIRKYFGGKIALYFAWLGFYTNMLILPSFVGLGCFLYGYATMDSKKNTPSREICDWNVAGNLTLCPLCDRTCAYQRLKESCMYSNISYLFDNDATVFFSIFMSFWATFFLELWKRKQALIAWQWDLYDITEDDDTRPEYDLSNTRFIINPVTRRKEPFVPTYERVFKIILSVVVVSFMILVVLCFVIVTIIIRLWLYTMAKGSRYEFLKNHAKISTTVVGALINLVTIIFLTRIYHDVAVWLTNMENPRTKMQYEKSFIVKIFLFEFMNYYASLIYISFFKGRFFTHPGDSNSRSSLFSRLKGDVCDPAGCFSELCIQLAIIMIGKQFFSNILELLSPVMKNWWRSRSIQSKRSKEIELTHWEANYALQDPGNLALFEEYLEMAIQYGFVTLFVAAFPLAPLFALLNNICEIRLDAYKMVAQARRPIAETVENIGAWYSILRGITYCAVVFNAFVIAFTSDYIPRKIYQYFYSENNDLVGYINSSLSVFNTSDFLSVHNKLGKGVYHEPETCHYRGYRYGPNHPDAYHLTAHYWIIFGARLLFIVIFEHLVFTVTEIISEIVPDVPYLVGRQMYLEKLLMESNIEQHLLQNDGSSRMDDYDRLLCELKRAQDSARMNEVVRRNTWVRRISRRISGETFGSLKNKDNSHA